MRPRGGDRAYPVLHTRYGDRGLDDRWLPDRAYGSVTTSTTPVGNPVSPDQVPGVLAWWKADGLALGDGDPVNNWIDSISGIHAQPNINTPSTAPSFRIGAVNGKPAVRFNGTTDALDVDYLVPHWDPPYVFLMVAKQTSKSTMGHLVSGWGDDHILISLDTNGFFGNGLVGNIQLSDGVDHSGAFHLFNLQRRMGPPFTALPTIEYVNGNKMVEGTVDYNQISSPRLGVNFTGDIAEIVFVPGAMGEVPAYYRQGLENYFYYKYGTPAPPSHETLPVTSGLAVWLTANSFDFPDGTAIPRDPYGWYSMVDGLPFYSNQFGAPVFKKNILNGQPSILFNGAFGCSFARFATTPGTLNIPQPSTFFMVAKGTAASGGFVYLSPGNQVVTLTTAGFGMGAGGGINDNTNHSAAFHVFSGVFNGASSFGRVDGLQTMSGNPGAGGITGTDFFIGSDQTQNANFYVGHLPVLIIFNRALNLTEIQAMEQFLKTKYGL